MIDDSINIDINECKTSAGDVTETRKIYIINIFKSKKDSMTKVNPTRHIFSPTFSCAAYLSMHLERDRYLGRENKSILGLNQTSDKKARKST